MRYLLLIFTSISLQAMSPNEALQKLVRGNERFVKNMAEHPNQGEKRRLAITGKQTPFAVIIDCSDSRVAPAIIFDQGLGDLFVVRVAGNVVGPIEVSSVLYAVKHLGSPLVVAIGHQNCGAVDAVVQNTTDDIPFIARLIQPAVDRARRENAKNVLEAAIKFNAMNMATFVEKFPTIAPFVTEKQIAVRSAYYDMDSGRVIFL